MTNPQHPGAEPSMRDVLAEICEALEDGDEFGALQIARGAGRAVLAAPQAPAVPAQRAQEPTDWKIKTPSGQVIYTDVDPRFEYTQSWLDDCYYITPLYAAPQEQALHREEALSRVRAVMARHHFQSRSFAEDLLDALGIGTVVPAETKQGEHQ